MFNLEKAHFILDEMVMNGCIIETNKNNVLAPVLLLDKAASAWSIKCHFGMFGTFGSPRSANAKQCQLGFARWWRVGCWFCLYYTHHMAHNQLNMARGGHVHPRTAGIMLHRALMVIQIQNCQLICCPTAVTIAIGWGIGRAFQSHDYTFRNIVDKCIWASAQPSICAFFVFES